MPVVAGTRLGPYEVVSRIGAGGMGEVWRAKDARLDRSVAIKVLPAEFADNAQLKLRFEREAKAISQLNHPHICTLHDVGHDSGVDFLVLELIEGETLADRIARGPLPLADVLRHGTEIADALDRAHRAGIIHRDLKPGNVMVTKSGTKLLDFGLAKPGNAVAGDNAATIHKALTQEGTILGTFQYMAPEQLEGSEADARTDIFSFGALLYEMATGHRAFDGKTKTSLIAAIVGGEPKPLRDVQPLAPSALQHVIAKCLEKDPDQRWQSAHDLAQELQWIASQAEEAPARRPRSLRVAIVVLSLLALIASAAAFYFATRKLALQTIESTLETDQSGGVDFYSGPPAFSPDGKWIAYSGRGGADRRMIFLRKLEGGKEQAIPGTNAGTNPFWSPDGQKIGFFTEAKMKIVSVSGGDVDVLADSDGASGGSWNSDNVILYAHARGPILRIPAGGGEPAAVTSPGKEFRSQRWPWFLPDGKHFLYLAIPVKGESKSAIFVGSLTPGEAPRRIVLAGTNAAYANGSLLFVREGVLRAQRFDPSDMKTTGDQMTIAPVQTFGWNTAALFAPSQNGLLAYQKQGSIELSQLTRKNRSGKTLGVSEQAYYWSPRLSYDGKTVAVDRSNEMTGDGDIWLVPTDGQAATRLTFETANETGPVWARDDSAVSYLMNQGRLTGEPMRLRVPGGRPETLIPNVQGDRSPSDWSPDGSSIAITLFSENAGTGRDVVVCSARDGRTSAVAATRADESGAQFSPDGRWIAYQSNETGRDEIYVQPFPPTGAKYQVSSAGGREPRWRTQHEIFYLAPDDRLTSMPVETEPQFRSGTPESLFAVTLRDGGFYAQYDAGSDGTFVLNELVPHHAAPMTLIINWRQRLAGAK